MRVTGIGIAVLWLLIFVASASSQFQPPTEKLLVRGQTAWTWTDGGSNILQVEGPVVIETDQAQLAARHAVIWLTAVPGAIMDQQRAEVALIGDASLRQGPVVRTGDRLLVTMVVRGTIRVTAEQRIAENRSDSEQYREAEALRPRVDARPGIAPQAPRDPEPPVQRPWMTPPSVPAAEPPPPPAAPPVRPIEPVNFRAAEIQTVNTPEGNVALILSGGITLLQPRANRDFVELRAERAVLFTPLKSLRELGEDREFSRVEDAITAAYLEGDVRIIYTPHATPLAEQRLQAERVYYEFPTDRAILTDAVIQTIEPTRQIPVIVRANTIRQLALGEYRTSEVQLSTSAFATPSYSVAADRAYVRQEDTGDPRYGTRTTFQATHATFRMFDVPLFYLPAIGGSITDRGMPLRSFSIDHSSRFGTAVRTEWGLFETLGQLPPRDLDIGYRLEYLSDRGPAAGVHGDYRGGFVSETTGQPWNFEGDFDAYGIYDDGEDRLGRRRIRVQQDDEFRGRITWQHQHFFPGDWQAQVRAGYVSDPTFLEQFFEREFDTGLPHEVAGYLKRQRGTEAFTALVTLQPSRYVTIADLQQEQFEIERFPELGFHRIGDSFWDDRLTFHSANTLSLLRFRESRATLAEQGFTDELGPGIPSLGTTGITDDTVYRADFRQQIDMPFDAGQFRVVPYLMGRYTPYSESPEGGSVNRLFAGAGVRISTAFWKVNEKAYSRLLDIHRLRHVIEPEVHVFASAMTEDREDVFVFDEPVDAINDVTAIQIAIRQRWQTKRGGPGRWRSVDFFALNLEANFFANQPDEAFLEPKVFRGLFFGSIPEASIPRNSLNADALWRISDTTVVLGDVQYNLDEMALSTTSIGLAAQRGERVSYFLGARYIGEINSTIGNFYVNYELSTKYVITLGQSVNFSQRRNQNSSIGVIRRFDRFLMTFSAYYDAVEDVSGIRFGIVPEGIFGITTQQFGPMFGGR